MKKVLLIGKNGQLGSELAKDASAFGFEVFPFDKEELDITNYMQVKEKIETIKPNVVINTAAYQIVSMCEQNPLMAMAVNFIAVQNLAKICKEHNIIFVTYSSDYVFDGIKGIPNEEGDAPNPLQMYGLSKLAGEYAALQVYPNGVFVIRTCGIYGGKYGSPAKGNFVLNIMKEAEAKEIIEVSSDYIISPTYACDLSKATLALLNSKAPFGVYHLANEGVCSPYEFAQEVFKLAGIKKPARSATAVAGGELKPVIRSGYDGKIRRPIFSALKNTKAKALGIVLPSWQEGLKSYISTWK